MPIGRSAGRDPPARPRRSTLQTPARDFVEIFERLREPELSPRYNLGPTLRQAVVRQKGNPATLLVAAFDFLRPIAISPQYDPLSAPNRRGASSELKTTVAASQLTAATSS